VLICEPYKGELVPLWRFKTPEIATASSKAIYKLFLAYLRQNDFVGAYIARKFLQMGFTRARRYTNYKGGRWPFTGVVAVPGIEVSARASPFAKGRPLVLQAMDLGSSPFRAA
jgi:hypothetical protein